MTYFLPGLGYGYDALAGSISQDVMQLHHSKHHQSYVDKLNAALEGVDTPRSLEALLGGLEALPDSIQTAVRNNGGGHYNHSLFWEVMSPDGGGQPGGALAANLDARYGSFQNFVDIFSGQAAAVFGSGWVWLQRDLEIVTLPNQDNPIMQGGEPPILGLDVWEHAYYLDYRNLRSDYIAAWWDVVNWQSVANRYPHN